MNQMPKRNESHRLLVIWLCDTQTSEKFVQPFSLLVGEGFLEALENRLVRCFSLLVALGIPQRGHVLLDAIFLEELHQIFAYELQAIICDNGLRDAKLADDVPSYEALYVHLSCVCHGLCFHLFGEVVGCHDHHASAPSSGWHWPYQVDCPLHERPKTSLQVQFVGRQCWYRLVALVVVALLY